MKTFDLTGLIQTEPFWLIARFDRGPDLRDIEREEAAAAGIKADDQNVGLAYTSPEDAGIVAAAMARRLQQTFGVVGADNVVLKMFGYSRLGDG